MRELSFKRYSDYKHDKSGSSAFNCLSTRLNVPVKSTCRVKGGVSLHFKHVGYVGIITNNTITVEIVCNLFHIGVR